MMRRGPISNGGARPINRRRLRNSRCFAGARSPKPRPAPRLIQGPPRLDPPPTPGLSIKSPMRACPAPGCGAQASDGSAGSPCRRAVEPRLDRSWRTLETALCRAAPLPSSGPTDRTTAADSESAASSTQQTAGDQSWPAGRAAPRSALAPATAPRVPSRRGTCPCGSSSSTGSGPDRVASLRCCGRSSWPQCIQVLGPVLQSFPSSAMQHCALLTCRLRFSILAGVRLRSLLVTALNLLPSMATMPWANSLRSRHSPTKPRQTFRMIYTERRTICDEEQAG